MKEKEIIKWQTCGMHFNGGDGKGTCDNGCQWFTGKICANSREVIRYEEKIIDQTNSTLTKEINQAWREKIGKAVKELDYEFNAMLEDLDGNGAITKENIVHLFLITRKLKDLTKE